MIIQYFLIVELLPRAYIGRGGRSPSRAPAEENMPARDQRPIVVTRPDLERLRILIEATRAHRKWEEMHLLALADELESAEVVEPE